MIKILIDSASDIDEAEAVEKGIFMIPILMGKPIMMELI